MGRERGQMGRIGMEIGEGSPGGLYKAMWSALRPYGVFEGSENVII